MCTQLLVLLQSSLHPCLNQQLHVAEQLHASALSGCQGNAQVIHAGEGEELGTQRLTWMLAFRANRRQQVQTYTNWKKRGVSEEQRLVQPRVYTGLLGTGWRLLHRSHLGFSPPRFVCSSQGPGQLVAVREMRQGTPVPGTDHEAQSLLLQQEPPDCSKSSCRWLSGPPPQQASLDPGVGSAEQQEEGCSWRCVIDEVL